MSQNLIIFFYTIFINLTAMIFTECGVKTCFLKKLNLNQII